MNLANHTAWTHLSHWYCINTFELGAEISNVYSERAGRLMSQVFLLEAESGKTKEQQLFLIYQFARWLAHASTKEIERSIVTVSHQVNTFQEIHKSA